MRAFHSPALPLLACAVMLGLSCVALAQLPLTPVALYGDDVPDLPGDEFFYIFTTASIGPSGRIAFGGFLTGAAVTFDNDTAVTAGFPGAFSLVAREGDPAPTGVGGETYDFVSSPSTNGAGLAGFRSTLDPAGFGIFRYTAGGTELLARDGTPVAEVGGGAMLSFQFGNRYPISDAGTVAFSGVMSGGPVTGNDNYAVFLATPGTIGIVARRGFTVPPGAETALYDTFEFLDMNASGSIAFVASLQNTGSTANDRGIWVSSSGVLSLVAREAGAAAGLPGVTFGTLGNAVGIGDDGTVAFCAELLGAGVTADNAESVWAGKPGGLKLIAREGEAAPGTESGVVFDKLVITWYPDIGPAVNPNGQAAFLARVRGPGVTDANNDGLWAQDGDGNLRLVVREGMMIPATGGDRPVGTFDALYLPITFSPVDGFGSANALIFTAETSGGSFDGVYVAAVPGRTPDEVAPTLRVNGRKKFVTEAAQVRLNGSASDNVGVDRVEYKVKGRPFRSARGTTAWKVKIRLAAGRNPVKLRAVDTSGNMSGIAKIIVLKR
jgi:hypothetical protein